ERLGDAFSPTRSQGRWVATPRRSALIRRFAAPSPGGRRVIITLSRWERVAEGRVRGGNAQVVGRHRPLMHFGGREPNALLCGVRLCFWFLRAEWETKN